MSGINEQFANNPRVNKFYTVTGSSTFVQFVSGSAKLLKIKADPNNVGTFFLDNYMQRIGMYPFDAGDSLEWCPAPYNLSELGHRNPSGTLDLLYLWVQD